MSVSPVRRERSAPVASAKRRTCHKLISWRDGCFHAGAFPPPDAACGRRLLLCRGVGAIRSFRPTPYGPAGGYGCRPLLPTRAGCSFGRSLSLPAIASGRRHPAGAYEMAWALRTTPVLPRLLLWGGRAPRAAAGQRRLLFRTGIIFTCWGCLLRDSSRSGGRRHHPLLRARSRWLDRRVSSPPADAGGTRMLGRALRRTSWRASVSG